VTGEEVVSIREIAEMFGVEKRTAIRYSHREDFPAPIASLGTGRIWRRADVEAWGREHLPLPAGRPKRD
jgi:prophage regulatory protein